MTGIGTDQLWAALRQRGAATLTGREGRVCNRRLLKVVDSVVFVDPGDFRCFIPADLTTPFTSHELAVALQHRQYRPQDDLLPAQDGHVDRRWQAATGPVIRFSGC